jgi:hypothetical protein
MPSCQKQVQQKVKGSFRFNSDMKELYRMLASKAFQRIYFYLPKEKNSNEKIKIP